MIRTDSFKWKLQRECFAERPIVSFKLEPSDLTWGPRRETGNVLPAVGFSSLASSLNLTLSRSNPAGALEASQCIVPKATYRHHKTLGVEIYASQSSDLTFLMLIPTYVLFPPPPSSFPLLSFRAFLHFFSLSVFCPRSLPDPLV